MRYIYLVTLRWFYSTRGPFCWNFTSDRTHKNILLHPRRGPQQQQQQQRRQPQCRIRVYGGSEGGWHQVPQEHLILISFAPTLWPTTWRPGISARIRSQSVLRLSGRNTQMAVNAGKERQRQRKRDREREGATETESSVVGRVNSLGASFLWAN